VEISETKPKEKLYKPMNLVDRMLIPVHTHYRNRITGYRRHWSQ